MAAFDEIQSYLARRIFLSYKNKEKKGVEDSFSPEIGWNFAPLTGFPFQNWS